MTAPKQWVPLEGFARAISLLDLDEWMFMGVCDDDTHPPLWQYKHITTRRYLHLDQAGHAWDHVVASFDRDGQLVEYVPHIVTVYRDALTALRQAS